MLEKKVLEDRDTVLEEEEDDIIILDARWEHWKDVHEDNENERRKFHALRWDVYKKWKEELIKGYFLVTVCIRKVVTLFGIMWRIILFGKSRITDK